MVFKEAVSLAVEGGKYVCGTIEEELTNYLAKHESVQKAVDYVRERRPEWTDERLNEYAFGSTSGQSLLSSKECLDKMGYDVSMLPVVEVPEFFPGMAGLIAGGAMGSMMLYLKGKSWLYNRREKSEKKDHSTTNSDSVSSKP